MEFSICSTRCDILELPLSSCSMVDSTAIDQSSDALGLDIVSFEQPDETVTDQTVQFPLAVIKNLSECKCRYVLFCSVCFKIHLISFTVTSFRAITYSC